MFSIKDDAQSLKRGQVLKIEFFAKLPGPFRIPLITGLKLNNERICPEVAPTNEDTKCVKFEKTGNETGGRWDGTLTFYPQFPRNGIRVDVQLDRPAWALGVSWFKVSNFPTLENSLLERSGRHQNFRPETIHHYDSKERPIRLTSVSKLVREVRRARGNSAHHIDLDRRRSGLRFWVDQPPAGRSAVQQILNNSAKIERNHAVGSSVSKFSQRDFAAPASEQCEMNREKKFQNLNSKIFLQNDFDCGLSGSPVQNRFSSGSQANVGQFPFHVAIFRDLIYRCGGSLVSQKTVVTAGHCVVRDNQQAYPSDDFRLLFGVVDLKSLSGAEAVREVAEVIKHPDYEYEKILKQDIAMMIIKGNLQFSPSIRPICLFDFQTPIQNHVNQKATVLGFGSTENSKDPSRYLNFGQMTVISRQSCIESKLIFGLLPEQSAFCAKAVENMIACPGDSGGKRKFSEKTETLKLMAKDHKRRSKLKLLLNLVKL